jgi:hypothetical protein
MKCESVCLYVYVNVTQTIDLDEGKTAITKKRDHQYASCMWTQKLQEMFFRIAINSLTSVNANLPQAPHLLTLEAKGSYRLYLFLSPLFPMNHNNNFVMSLFCYRMASWKEKKRGKKIRLFGALT